MKKILTSSLKKIVKKITSEMTEELLKAKDISGLSIQNLTEGLLDLDPNMPVRSLFEVIAGVTEKGFAAVFTATRGRDAAHHDVDFALLEISSELPFGSLCAFVEWLEYLSDVGLETVVNNEE